LTNLISNACKFSPPDNKVEIRVLRDGNMIRVAVSDYGPGIPPEFQARLFQKFAQADGSDTRQKGGTGLGLSIAKAIVENHNGTIGFDSIPGAGTTFYFQIPGRVVPVAAAGTSTPNNRILICEDDADIARLLELLLRQSGFETDTAYSAAAARTLLTEKQYAVLTLDLMLPDEDGISLIRQLRAAPATHSLPIVVVSATAEQGRIRLNGDAFWVADWLRKPINPEQLVRAVANAAQPTRNAKPRILHVEADADVRHVVSNVLDDIAIITPAQDRAQARAMLESQSFDLVILDSGMPDGSGMDLLPLLSKSDMQIPVVIFSDGREEPELLQEVSSVLVKSKASNEQLLNTITHLIQRQTKKEIPK
jgi:DNA-binding response OmpR family regulator